MTEITLNDVYKSYGDEEVIHGIDLHVSSGEFLVLVGPSGCGKSTLLRIVAGLEQVTSGDVVIDDQRVNDVGAADRGLAMVFQSYALYPHMNVYRNMAFGLENTKIPRSEIDQRVNEVAAMLQITPLLKRKPKALSGGQRQRVAIGRAIVRDPKAFLFDEPLSNLDAELRVAMRKELAALHAKIGGTMIYVTHDQTEAMTLADTIVVLNDGIVEQAGAPLELYNNPNNMFVAQFIGSPRMNTMEATVKSTAEGFDLIAGAQRFSIPRIESIEDSERVSFGVRPEHIAIVSESEADVIATVELSEQLGGETYLYCAVENYDQLTVHQLGQLASKPGEQLPLRFDRQHMHIFDANGNTVINGLETTALTKNITGNRT